MVVSFNGITSSLITWFISFYCELVGSMLGFFHSQNLLPFLSKMSIVVLKMLCVVYVFLLLELANQHCYFDPIKYVSMECLPKHTHS